MKYHVFIENGYDGLEYDDEYSIQELKERLERDSKPSHRFRRIVYVIEGRELSDKELRTLRNL